MTQVTPQQRISRIEVLLKALNSIPPEKYEVVRLPWPGGELHAECNSMTSFNSSVGKVAAR